MDQLRFEHDTHARCAIAAHTHEANAAAHKLLNRRNSDVFAQASSHDIAGSHGKQQGAGHDLALRLAAAIASRALE
jgi:hypothetical protein